MFEHEPGRVEGHPTPGGGAGLPLPHRDPAAFAPSPNRPARNARQATPSAARAATPGRGDAQDFLGLDQDLAGPPPAPEVELEVESSEPPPEGYALAPQPGVDASWLLDSAEEAAPEPEAMPEPEFSGVDDEQQASAVSASWSEAPRPASSFGRVAARAAAVVVGILVLGVAWSLFRAQPPAPAAENAPVAARATQPRPNLPRLVQPAPEPTPERAQAAPELAATEPGSDLFEPAERLFDAPGRAPVGLGDAPEPDFDFGAQFAQGYEEPEPEPDAGARGLESSESGVEAPSGDGGAAPAAEVALLAEDAPAAPDGQVEAWVALAEAARQRLAQLAPQEGAAVPAAGGTPAASETTVAAELPLEPGAQVARAEPGAAAEGASSPHGAAGGDVRSHADVGADDGARAEAVAAAETAGSAQTLPDVAQAPAGAAPAAPGAPPSKQLPSSAMVVAEAPPLAREEDPLLELVRLARSVANAPPATPRTPEPAVVAATDSGAPDASGSDAGLALAEPSAQPSADAASVAAASEEPALAPEQLQAQQGVLAAEAAPQATQDTEVALAEPSASGSAHALAPAGLAPAAVGPDGPLPLPVPAEAPLAAAPQPGPPLPEDGGAPLPEAALAGLLASRERRESAVKVEDVLLIPTPSSGALRRVDPASMPGVWSGTTIPFDAIGASTRLLTPSVGRVRVRLHGGELFEGNLYAVGEGHVWIDSQYGRMGLSGARVAHVDQLDNAGAGRDPGAQQASQPSQRVRVKTPGGVFFGRVVATDAGRTTIVTDEGARITLDSKDVELLVEAPRVSLKSRPGEAP